MAVPEQANLAAGAPCPPPVAQAGGGGAIPGGRSPAAGTLRRSPGTEGRRPTEALVGTDRAHQPSRGAGCGPSAPQMDVTRAARTRNPASGRRGGAVSVCRSPLGEWRDAVPAERYSATAILGEARGH